MKKKHAGAAPVERPTEWTVGVVMLASAVLMWSTNHDTAALIAVGAAVLPAFVTAAVVWFKTRNDAPEA